MPVVAVVPTFDSERWIARFAAAGGPLRVPCVFVDNGSSDGTLDAIRRHAPEATVVEAGGNLGYGAAANVGAARVPGADVLVLNPDVELRPKALERLVQTLAGDPRLGAVAPILVNPDGSLQPSAHRFPTLGDLARWTVRPDVLRMRQPPGPPLMHVGWATGAVLLVRRAAWDAIGGFDPAYRHFVEEVDLQRRLGATRWPLCALDLRVTAVHHGGGRPIPARLFARSHDGWERYFGVHGGGRPAQAAARALLCAGALSRAAAWSAIAATRPARRDEALAWARMFAAVTALSAAKLPRAATRAHAPYDPRGVR